MTPPRQRIHDAIQASNDIEDEVEGAVLTGWVTIAEWMDEDGEMWLTKIAGKAGGGEPTSWAVGGYLHEALYHWPPDA